MSRAIRAERRTNFLLPPSIEDWIPKDDPARFVADIVDQLDLRKLGFQDPDPLAPGAPAYSAALLLSVWLYGYMRRIRSTRQLEIACRERMSLIWLTGMERPDHNTLWRFFRVNRARLRGVFRDVLATAHRAGLVGMVLHALDGTKLQAACSTDTALHGGSLEKLLKEITTAIEAIERQIEEAESHETGEVKLSEALTNAQARREQIKQSLEQLAALGTEHAHPTEPEATVVGMRGGGFRLGYNAQAVSDENQLIVAEDVEAQPTDQALLTPMLDRVVENLGEAPEQTLVDAGYVSAEHLASAHAKQHSIIVPDGVFTHSQEDPSDPYDKSHFTYDAERDVYVCPEGDLMPATRLTRSRKNQAQLKVYRCRNKECLVRGQCTTDKSGRTIRRSPHDQAIVQQRKMQQSRSDCAALYGRRKTLIEPIFAVIKAIDGFRRFTMRGLDSARAQWALICTAYNLRKLLPRWRAGRLLAKAT